MHDYDCILYSAIVMTSNVMLFLGTMLIILITIASQHLLTHYSLNARLLSRKGFYCIKNLAIGIFSGLSTNKVICNYQYNYPHPHIPY